MAVNMNGSHGSAAEDRFLNMSFKASSDRTRPDAARFTQGLQNEELLSLLERNKSVQHQKLDEVYAALKARRP
jgi:hypothetical protein